jgi:hypothetical protein
MDFPFSNQWVLFAFIGLFTVIGTLVMSRGLRGLITPPRKPLQSLFLLVWSVMFIGIPLFIGWQAAGVQFVLMQSVLAIIVLVFALTVLPRISIDMQGTPYGTILFGGLFVVVGLGAGGMMLRQRSGLIGTLLFVLVFSGSGALVMAQGLRQAITGETSPDASPDSSSDALAAESGESDDDWWKD